MGIRYQVDELLDVCVVVWSGRITADDFLGHVRRMASDPAWPPRSGCHYTDLRGASIDSSLVDSVREEALSIITSKPFSLLGLRVGIVAAELFPDAAEFCRQMWPHGVAAIVFNLHADACAWLQADPEAIQRVADSLREPS